jgi:predicted RNA polymerase sigma factor
VSNNAETEFTEFFQASWEPCLRAVTAVVGSPQLAEDQVAEAFAKAWGSWRKVSCHPAPRAWADRVIRWQIARAVLAVAVMASCGHAYALTGLVLVLARLRVGIRLHRT